MKKLELAETPAPILSHQSRAGVEERLTCAPLDWGAVSSSWPSIPAPFPDTSALTLCTTEDACPDPETQHLLSWVHILGWVLMTLKNL